MHQKISRELGYGVVVLVKCVAEVLDSDMWASMEIQKAYVKGPGCGLGSALMLFHKGQCTSRVGPLSFCMRP